MATTNNTIDNRKEFGWIIHLLAFLVLFTIPFFLNPRHNEFTFVDYISFLVPMCAFVAVFYINYFYLIKKFLYNKKIGHYILINLLIIAVFAFLLNMWGEFYFSTYIAPEIRGRNMHHVPWYSRVIRDVTFMAMAAIISIAVKMTGEWYRVERERTKILAVASQAELKNLKNQLNPHFLFNTLNNIYALMRIDTQKAQNAILELSKLLRYVLGCDNQEFAQLKEEIAFTRNYIELMALRLGKNVTLTVDIPSFEANTDVVPPLLFISLVENAFKHGTSQNQPSFIKIAIFLTQSGAEGRILVCEVANSYFPKDESDRSGSGIGVENLKKRLALLYPGGHTIVSSVRNGQYVTILTIKL